jgi:long-chain acyl-CoA synthetase
MDLEARCADGMALAHWAAVAPSRPALISDRGDRTFAELNARANQLTRALRRRGLQAGDAVALLVGNTPEFVETWAACQRAGWRLTPVNRHLTAEEASYIVEDCEAKALVVDTDLAAAAGLGAARVLALGPDYEKALADEDDGDIDDPVLGNTMMYTSGTTGRPKGVERPPLTLPPDPRYRGEEHLHLCTGPLYHAAPYVISLVTPLTNGVGVVLMAEWDPEETLRLVERHRITHTHMVPTMFHRLLALPEDVKRKYDLSSLRMVVHGAAPCPVHVKRGTIEWLGPILTEYYSSTEGYGCIVDSRTWLEKPGTVGRPGEQAYVGDEDGRPLAAGKAGLVWLKPLPGSRFRYFKDDVKTAQSYRGDYYTLGDVGHLDEDGYLFLTDRSANLIISGGVNVYPAEVDAVLLEHPSVADAATIGIPDEEWGERVTAVVELRPDAVASDALAADLVAHCRARLAAFKCPRRVEFTDRLPRQDNGKVYRRLLRQRYRAATEEILPKGSN